MQTPPPSPPQARTSALTPRGQNFRPHPPGAQASGYCGTRRAVPYCSRITLPTKNPLSIQHTLRSVTVLPGRLYFATLHHWLILPVALTRNHSTNQTTHILPLLHTHTQTHSTRHNPHSRRTYIQKHSHEHPRPTKHPRL